MVAMRMTCCGVLQMSVTKTDVCHNTYVLVHRSHLEPGLIGSRVQRRHQNQETEGLEAQLICAVAHRAKVTPRMSVGMRLMYLYVCSTSNEQATCQQQCREDAQRWVCVQRSWRQHSRVCSWRNLTGLAPVQRKAREPSSSLLCNLHGCTRKSRRAWDTGDKEVVTAMKRGSVL